MKRNFHDDQISFYRDMSQTVENALPRNAEDSL